MLEKTQQKRIDPRVKRTRQLIQQAFMDLLKEKAFQHITVQDVADRAEVNRATFYAHFEDKYALMEHMIREKFHEEMTHKLLEAGQLTVDSLPLIIVAVCEFVSQLNHTCIPSDKQFRPLVEEQIKIHLSETLLLWSESVTPDRSQRQLRPELAAMMASWAIYGAAVQWQRSSPQPPVREFARQISPIIMATLNQ